MKYSEYKGFLKFFALLTGAMAFWFLIDNYDYRGYWFYGVLVISALCSILYRWADGIVETKSKNKKALKNRTVVQNVPTKPTRWLWVVLCIVGLMLVFVSSQWRVQLFNSSIGRLLTVLIFAGIGTILLKRQDEKKSLLLNFSILLLAYGVAYRTLGFMAEIQTGPFALGWSEGSRFYNASTFVAQSLYGKKLSLPVLHPSRYLLQALPFFVGLRSIFAHRIWQVILWLGATLLGSWLITRRVRSNFPFPKWLLLGFVFLFFFQGAVYYHLMVIVILVLSGFDPDKPWKTLCFVALASLWAGISRVNWIPVPGLLAVSLLVLEKPIQSKRWLNYLLWPMVWVLASVLIGLATKQAYVKLSGENPAYFDSAFSSALMWHRLLPNPTFFLGILPAILLVCLPISLLAIEKMRSGLWGQVHWLRWSILGGILAVFFAGGILVSLKIGGGGDLHNMDAFLVFFVLVALDILVGKVASEREGNLESKFRYWQQISVVIGVVVAVFFNLYGAGSINLFTNSAQQADIRKLNRAIRVVENEPGEVLFIAERQLLTFNAIDYRYVVEPYDKVFLMEMAMGRNMDYLNKFYADLESGKYKMVVTDTIATHKQERDTSFSDENNAWVELVLSPLLDNYSPVATLRGGNVNLLIPKGNEPLEARFIDVED